MSTDMRLFTEPTPSFREARSTDSDFLYNNPNKAAPKENGNEQKRIEKGGSGGVTVGVWEWIEKGCKGRGLVSHVSGLPLHWRIS